MDEVVMEDTPIELEAGETAIVFRKDGRVVMYAPEDVKPEDNDLVLRMLACLEALQDDKMRAILYTRILGRMRVPYDGTDKESS